MWARARIEKTMSDQTWFLRWWSHDIGSSFNGLLVEINGIQSLSSINH
jgi:hypothetical protein